VEGHSLTSHVCRHALTEFQTPDGGFSTEFVTLHILASSAEVLYGQTGMPLDQGEFPLYQEPV
jgi:hypothetical protein